MLGIGIFYGIPMLWTFHWTMDTVTRYCREHTGRLVALLYGDFLLILMVGLAVQVVPVSVASPLTVFGMSSLAILLVALGIHFYLRILGWWDRWPKAYGPVAAYAWTIPTLGLLAVDRHAVATVRFMDQHVWRVPVYNASFHLAMWIAVGVGCSLLVALVITGRHAAIDPLERGKIRGLVVGTLILVLATWGLGAQLPIVTPQWMPPYPYLIGMFLWLGILRWTITHYEFLLTQVQRHQSLFTLTPVPILMVDLAGRIVERNPAAAALLGKDRRHLRDLLDLSDRAQAWQPYHRALLRRQPLRGWQIALKDARGDSRIFVMEGEYLLVDGRACLVLALHDHTRQEQDLYEIRRQLTMDPLTGIANRKALYDLLGAAIKNSSSDWAHFAVLWLDVDDFKHINDTFGHLVGDAVLKSVSQRLHESIRAQDSVARFGGDEFVVVLAHIEGPSQAQRVIQTLASRCAEPLVIAVHDPPLTISVRVSIGYSVFPEDGTTVDALLNTSDQSMYHEKRSRKRSG